MADLFHDLQNAGILNIRLMAWWLDPGNPVAGLALFLAGCAGVLLAVYLTDLEFLPHMAGGDSLLKLRLDADRARERREWVEARQASSDRHTRSVEEAAKLQSEVDNYKKTEDLYTKRLRAVRWVRLPTFAVIGGVFAAVFTADLVHAALLGAAWPTAVIALMGVGRRVAEVGAEAVDESQKVISAQREQIADEIRKAEVLRQRVRERERAFRAAIYKANEELLEARRT